MQKTIQLKLSPREAADDHLIKQQIAATENLDIALVTGFTILKRSLDARSRQPWFNLKLTAYINEPAQQRLLPDFSFKDVHQSSKEVIIVGAGPAGLFAALQLLEAGIKPIVLERGKDVKSRRRDLAA